MGGSLCAPCSLLAPVLHMRRFLVSVVLLALAVPLAGGVPYRDSTSAEWYLRAGPFPSVDAFFEAAGERDLLAAGTAFSPERDPDAQFEYLWAIEADTSAWVQSPSGAMMLIDPYALWALGEFAEERLDGGPEVEYVGYGWEDGNLYLYMTQSAPVFWVLGGVAVFLVAFALSIVKLVRNLRRSRERERQLSESRRRIVDSREDERLGLSRDLHDGPLQDLQALRMHLGVAEHMVAEGGEQDLLRASVVGVQEELVRVIDEVRQISEGLRPPVLSSFGLTAALRALVNRLQGQTDADIVLDAEGEGNDLSDSVRLTLYRVAQEGLNNALEHSGCTRVRIRFWTTSSDAHLAIEDDGRGFDVPPELHVFEQDGHLGLAGMAERASALRGTLDVDSSASGTRIHICVPVQLLALT